VAPPPTAVETAKEVIAQAKEDAGKNAEADVAALSAIQAVRDTDISNAKPQENPTDTPLQADFLPGTRVNDFTRLPVRVYDEISTVVRECTRPNEYKYLWAHPDKISGLRLQGYRHVLYDGGPGSGVASRGFVGTALYERTLDNHVRNGDTLLMYAPMKLYEEIRKEQHQRNEDYNRAAEESFHDQGYQRGVRTFKEVDGGRVERN
jgi:hypothetical protein